MDEYSILIGGKAGYGIDKSGAIIASLLGRLGFRIYVYRDYPSLIRGGHTFSIIRASKEKIAAHMDKVDCILALNQDTVNLHKARLKPNGVVIYDSDSAKSDGMPIALGKIIKEEGGQDIMRNTGIIGALCKAIGMEWDVVEAALKKSMPKETELNLKIAHRAYDEAKERLKIGKVDGAQLPLFTGNELVGMGLIKAGLETYIAYPMTPSSPILHFLANAASKFSLNVIHPESEISVILMALGFSYCGQKAAVGTSGGGFCLMTEGLSFAGMAELPVVIIVGQRPGPSTGLPTYSSQTDLHFVLHAGQGEFTRFVVAPGDAEEAYYWPQVALNMSWKYQVPSIILTDKTLGEGTYSFEAALVKELAEENAPRWDGKGQYKRYLNTENGVSPLTFTPDKNAIIKINSYEHDEYGVTTEDPAITTMMQDKRLRKEGYIAGEMKNYEAVKVYGRRDAQTAILCWGSNKGVCVEAANRLGLKVIQPVVLSPFPLEQFKEAMKTVKTVIAVENNAHAQLVMLINRYGFDADKKILKYDGRPFSIDELEGRLREVIK